MIHQACIIYIYIDAGRTLFSFFVDRAGLSPVAPNVEENMIHKSALCCPNRMFSEHRRDPNGRVDPWKRHRVEHGD